MADNLPTETIYRGEARSLVVTVTDDAGNPVNLAAATLHYRVARSAAAPALLSVNQPAIAVSGAGGNVVTIPRTGDNTKALPARTLYHELYRSDTGAVLAKADTLKIEPAQLARHPAA